MPATAEDLLALLDTPHWKTAGSTSVRPEGPTARATDGSAPMNLLVLDHIADGRRTLTEADALAAKGTADALAQAHAMRRTQAAKTAALMGDTSAIRQTPCPACGCHSLVWRGCGDDGRAVCVNLHCSPTDRPRSWKLADALTASTAKPGPPRRHTSPVPPRDLTDLKSALVFLAQSARPISATTLRRLCQRHRIPAWRSGARHLLSMSDLLTVHAAWVSSTEPEACERADTAKRPACAGLADLFFTDGQGSSSPQRVEAAKRICRTCPLQAVCLEEALARPAHDQFGVFGGLTAPERQALIKTKTAN